MNNELKISDLKADKKRIEYEISELINRSLMDFTEKYGVDANLSIEIDKVCTCSGEIMCYTTKTHLEFQI